MKYLRDIDMVLTQLLLPMCVFFCLVELPNFQSSGPNCVYATSALCGGEGAYCSPLKGQFHKILVYYSIVLATIGGNVLLFSHKVRVTRDLAYICVLLRPKILYCTLFIFSVLS